MQFFTLPAVGSAAVGDSGGSLPHTGESLHFFKDSVKLNGAVGAKDFVLSLLQKYARYPFDCFAAIAMTALMDSRLRLTPLWYFL